MNQPIQMPSMWPSGGSGGRVFTSLNPTYRAAAEVSYISNRDMSDAIGGDSEAMGRVIDRVGEAAAHNKENLDSLRAVETVAFGWKEPDGVFTFNRVYSFGGSLLRIHQSTMVNDVRNRDSIGRNTYQGDYGDGGWSFFPWMGYSIVTHDGAAFRSWAIYLPNLFGVLSVCVVLAWIVVLVGVRLGVSAIRKRSLQAALYLTLLVLAGFLGSSNVSFFDRVQSNHSQDIAQSQAYQVDELIQAASDDSALIALCQELLDLVPVQETDLLLSQAWTFTPSPVNRWTKPTTDRLHVSIGYQGMLVSYEKRVYQVRDGETIPARHRKPFWDGIRDFGIVAAHWGPIENQKSLSVGLFHLISIGVLFWLAWRVSHGLSRFVFGRIQKRRVLRNQCVYCAYPLTQEATQARYPEVGS